MASSLPAATTGAAGTAGAAGAPDTARETGSGTSPGAAPRPRWVPALPAGQGGRIVVIVVALSSLTLVAAEWALLVGGLVAGTLAHGVALLALVGISLVRDGTPEGRLALALVVLPVLRILSIALPARIVPEHLWYLEIGAPVLLAVALAARALQLPAARLGLRPGAARDLLILGVVGAVLGLPAYLIAEPRVLVPDPSPVTLILISVIVVIFGAAVEELLFRGLIQGVAEEFFGAGSVVVSTAATGLLYLASGNLRYVVLAIGAAALFGLVARRTGSIAAPIAGHGALLWTQLVLWPAILST